MTDPLPVSAPAADPSPVLHLGDALAPEGLRSLAPLSVDHVICDPPYSPKVHRGLGRERRTKGKAREVLTFEHLSLYDLRLFAHAFAAIVRRWIVIFTDDRSLGYWIDAMEQAGADHACTGQWVKEAPMPRMRGDRPAYGVEQIAIFHAPTKGHTRWNGGGRTAVYYANPVRKGNHPTEKPLDLLCQITADFTDPGETILDPFMGAGTTGVAAKRLGRGFIGWEIDPKFYEVASARIEGTQEQLRLDFEPQGKQGKLALAEPAVAP